MRLWRVLFLSTIFCFELAVAVPVTSTVAPLPTSGGQCVVTPSPLPTPSQSPSSQWPPDCATTCPKGINVQCLSNEALERQCGIPAPCAKLGGCTVYLSNDDCRSFGVTSGTLPLDRFKQAFQCQGNPAITDFNSIIVCCSLHHEMYHACSKEGARPLGCEERNARHYDKTCVDQTIQYLCGGTPPRWDAGSCRYMCHESLGQSVLALWDNCICNAQLAHTQCGASFNFNSCCNCTSACQDPSRVTGMLPPVCSGLLGLPGNSDIIKEIKEGCNSMWEGAHGCSYYTGESGKCPTVVGTIDAY